MVGEQAYTLRNCADPKKYLNQNISAVEIAKNIQRDCGSYSHYRLAINTFNGDTHAYIASNGCHSNNQLCGSLNTTNFVIVGGGLKRGFLFFYKKKEFWKLV